MIRFGLVGGWLGSENHKFHYLYCKDNLNLCKTKKCKDLNKIQYVDRIQLLKAIMELSKYTNDCSQSKLNRKQERYLDKVLRIMGMESSTLDMSSSVHKHIVS